MATDLSSLLAHGVRDVVPQLLRRHLSYTFAERDTGWRVEGDGRRLQTSFHRLFMGASELLQRGYVAYHAVTRVRRAGGCSLRLQVGGTGPLCTGDALDATLRSLALAPGPGAGPAADSAPAAWPSQPGLRRAHGVCPASAARVDFSCLPAAGFLFSVVYAMCDAEPLEQPPAPETGPAESRLWLVHADRINAESVKRQAQAQGWAVTRIASLEEAARRLRARAAGQPLPTRVVIFACDGAPPSALQGLRGLLPAAVHFVYAVEVGSIWLRDVHDSQTLAGSELCCHPIATSTWRCWRHAAAHPVALPAPSPSPAAARLPVLVVDDDELCRCLAEALLQALGYQTRLAVDGQQAIAHCSSDAPALVLMDLDMPNVDGFEATRRLRALQRAGLLPPFRILAASAAPDRDWIGRALEAGADAFLPKPLRVETLRGELSRWCVESLPTAQAPLSTI